MTDMFDSDGFPADDDALLGYLGTHLLDEVGKDGWDNPPRFFTVLNPVGSAAVAASAGIEVPDAAGPGYFVQEIPVPVVHPTLALVGYTPGPDVAALVQVVEAWMSAGPVLNQIPRPSQDPNRVEVRIVTVVTRSGRVWSRMQPRFPDTEAAHRLRDSDATDSFHLEGAQVDVMKYTLGIPISTPALPPRLLLAARVVNSAAHLVSETDIGADSITARAATEMLTLHVAWAASGHGKRFVETRHGKLFAALARDPSKLTFITDSDYATIRGIYDALADITWDDLLTNKHSRELIPEEVRPVLTPTEHRRWCTDALITTIVTRFRDYAPEATRKGLIDTLGPELADEMWDALPASWVNDPDV